MRVSPLNQAERRFKVNCKKHTPELIVKLQRDVETNQCVDKKIEDACLKPSVGLQIFEGWRSRFGNVTPAKFAVTWSDRLRAPAHLDQTKASTDTLTLIGVVVKARSGWSSVSVSIAMSRSLRCVNHRRLF